MPFIFFCSLGQFSTMYFTICLAIRFLSSSRKNRYQNRNDCIVGEIFASALHSRLVRRVSASTTEAAVDDEAVEVASDLAVETANDLVEALGAGAIVEASEAATGKAFGKALACKASHCFLFIILLRMCKGQQTYKALNTAGKRCESQQNSNQCWIWCSLVAITQRSNWSIYKCATTWIRIRKGPIENSICQRNAVANAE